MKHWRPIKSKVRDKYIETTTNIKKLFSALSIEDDDYDVMLNPYGALKFIDLYNECWNNNICKILNSLKAAFTNKFGDSILDFELEPWEDHTNGGFAIRITPLYANC